MTHRYTAASDGWLAFITPARLLFVAGSPDAATIDRLWNPFVAAWYTGKDDPTLRLLRFDPEGAEIWLNDSSLLAGIKMLVGIDPKRDYRDNVATVKLAKG